MLEIVKRIEGLVEKLRPQVVFTQHGGDLNIDHVQLYRATLNATRPMAGTRVRTVYATRSRPQQNGHLRSLPQSIDRRYFRLQVYESELRAFSHPRAAESLRAIAKRLGSVSGLFAAEAFSVVRDLR